MKNSEGKSIGVFTNVWSGCFLHICLQIPQKRKNRKINFDELPKRNSRIKIITIKIIRFETKVLNFTF